MSISMWTPRLTAARERRPRYRRGVTLAVLKRYEDALDALLCAWTGIGYLAGEVGAYGDASTPVWAP